MALSLPTAAQAAAQTPLNTFSPSSTPLFNTVNGLSYTYDPVLGVWSASAPGGTAVSSFSGGTTGLTPAGAATGPVTLGGTLGIGNGGTGATTGAGALAGMGLSINASGGTTGLSFTGGPITSSGTLTMGGTLGIGNGGTGQTTANAALNALLPGQGGNSGKVLTTDGTNTSWAAAGGGVAAWVNCNVFGGMLLTGASPNITSVGYATAGIYVVNFTALASANYAAVAVANTTNWGGNSYVPKCNPQSSSACAVAFGGLTSGLANITSDVDFNFILTI